MKVLCVCEGGNVRSRALAYVLHDLMGHEAIPVGVRWMTAETMILLGMWADRIVVMQPHLAERLTVIPRLHEKLRVLDVGPDTYGLNISDALMNQVMAKVNGVL